MRHKNIGDKTPFYKYIIVFLVTIVNKNRALHIKRATFLKDALFTLIHTEVSFFYFFITPPPAINADIVALSDNIYAPISAA